NSKRKKAPNPPNANSYHTIVFHHILVVVIIMISNSNSNSNSIELLSPINIQALTPPPPTQPPTHSDPIDAMCALAWLCRLPLPSALVHTSRLSPLSSILRHPHHLISSLDPTHLRGFSILWTA